MLRKRETSGAGRGRDGTTDEPRDLGFGSVVAGTRRQRLLNADGSFNVQRHGLRRRPSIALYDFLLYLSWPRFLACLAAFYLVLNTLFALAFLALGEHALAGGSELGPFARAFFFSVESLSTVGYGHIVPVGFAANLLMTVESFVGLLTVALATGISFGRFSRPTAHIRFSRNAVFAPYQGGQGLMFRLVNQRRSELIEVAVQVTFSRFEVHDGRTVRRFYPLALERTKVVFLPLAWTVVHPIEAESPLAGLGREELLASDAELLVLLTATDEASAATVHARTSYRAEELVWDARFGDLFLSDDDTAPLAIDVRRLDALIGNDERKPAQSATATPR